MTITTVVCVWVHGHVRYSVDYVHRLHSMVTRWMDRPFTFVCLTDEAVHFEGTPIQGYEIPSPYRGIKGWWSKLRVFDASNPHLRGRVLYLDLDTLVVAPLAPILDFPAKFALIPHSGKFNGTNGRAVVKRFNSSVMVFNAGSQHDIWRRFSPGVTHRLHGDQDFIGEQCPQAATMPLAWFPRISEINGPPFGEAKVVLVKTPKNDKAVKQFGWFAEAWA